jgi:serine/threonine protein phosphatase PrpC
MDSAERGIRIRTSARTSTGQVRENNEDNVYLWSSDEYALAVVADGMGGAAAGEEASRLAVEAIESGLNPEAASHDVIGDMSDEFLANKIADVIRSGNLNIVRRAATHPEFRGMGTTVTLAFVRGLHATVAHVGDSRAYMVDSRNRRIVQVTDDHSFVEALVAAGHLTQEQAEEHPMRNVLYRALGQAEDLDVDVYEVRLQANDRLVLCSDGLTRHVRAHEISEIVLVNRDPEVASQLLIDLANARGGEDNVSVIIVLLEKDSASESAAADQSTVELKPVEPSPEETLLLKDEHFIKALSDTDDTFKATDTLAEASPEHPLRVYESGGEGRDPRTPFQ